MRAGGCTVQQALTTEAASVVKQAVTLARRRGHAQVTPLHVANTMLSASAGLLRTACLQSRSHPLQCRALELCFNVALNRLPASTSSGPMLGSHHYSQNHQQQHHPSISNALVAAFKRAQAHQRRGSIENQQQPLLAVKIELEQLIISILDDPSVSRVMREAGFSSTQVKSNVEQAVSLEICNNNNNNSSKSKEEITKTSSSDPIRNEDVMYVIDNMAGTNYKKRRCTVIVGESVACVEGAARRVMDRIEKGDVQEVLRGVKFLNLSLFSFARLARDGVDNKLEELKSLIKSYVMAGHGVVLFLGDLKWTAEYRSSRSSGINNYYCPVEHVVMEIGKLVSRIGENERFWLMGIATFQTYMACKSGHLSLENIWGLNPLTIPAGTLRLSLVADSDEQSQSSSKKGENGSNWLQVELGSRDDNDGRDDDDDQEDYENELSCCADCSAKFESEARSLRSNGNSARQDQSSSTLPAWLQHYKNQNKLTTDDQDCVSVRDLCKKWNSICSSLHKSEKTLTFSSIISPSSTSTSNFSYPVLHRNKSWPQNSHFYINAESNSTPNSTCSSDVMEVEYVHKFKELNAENLKTLCEALEKMVPSNKDIVPEIASTILQCRSGLVKRKQKQPIKEETWLFFQGVDVAGKENIARELARLIFGSNSRFVSISLSSFSSTRADSTDLDCRNKRSRDEQSCSYIERFAEAVSENPRRVFFVEDVDQADYCSQIGFKRAIERGTVTNSSGEVVSLGDAVVILSCESFSSRSRACSPSTKQRTSSDGSSDEQDDHSKNGGGKSSPCVSLDLNMCIDDDSVEDARSIDDIGLLESVDKRIVFKFHDL